MNLQKLDKENFLFDVERVKSSLVQTFLSVDSALNGQLVFDTESSGSTCVCVLTIGDKLYCSNLGDSGAGLLCKLDGYLALRPLSQEHLPHVPHEASRVLLCGGRIEAIRGSLL